MSMRTILDTYGGDGLATRCARCLDVANEAQTRLESEVRRSGNGVISSEGYTYFWSSRTDGTHRVGVAVGISSRLQHDIVKVTPVDGLMILVKLNHTVDFISFIALYTPTEVYNLEEKEMFESIVDQYPPDDTLIVLGDFNAVPSTDKDGYEVCIGFYISGTRMINSSLLLNFAKSRRLRIAGSWFQRREPHRWT
ncbi:uncharacterized protein LOC143032686 [Oratosquilla oratoria]|uniref:uncharacterized protein LOC143032686 n=1 Tax=Oratosquilla oratoria TaxID=337810 RepID=UPI003F77520B